MKVRCLASLALGLTVVTGACAQVGAAVTLFGSMDVMEGGRANAFGRVDNSSNGPVGSVEVRFDQGTLQSVKMARFDSFFANFFTAAVGGPAVAMFSNNGALQAVKGRCVVMVDDLDLLDPDRPDQFFLHFTAERTGTVTVRHGLMVRGEITILLP